LGARICAGERHARRGQDDVMGSATIDQSEDRSDVPVVSKGEMELRAEVCFTPGADIAGKQLFRDFSDMKFPFRVRP
jgi:hypothetical protein